MKKFCIALALLVVVLLTLYIKLGPPSRPKLESKKFDDLDSAIAASEGKRNPVFLPFKKVGTLEIDPAFQLTKEEAVAWESRRPRTYDDVPKFVAKSYGTQQEGRDLLLYDGWYVVWQK